MDGTPDYRDTDTDNDGVPDFIEANDANMDGVTDFVCDATMDLDNDGLLDCYDSHDNTSDDVATGATIEDIIGSNSPTQNTDLDDERDWRDEDDDNDGIPTSVEAVSYTHLTLPTIYSV